MKVSNTYIIEMALNNLTASYFRDLRKMKELFRTSKPCRLPWLEDLLLETCDIWRLTRKYNRGDILIDVYPAPVDPVPFGR